MFSASSLTRLAACLVGSAIALAVVPHAAAQYSIQVSLNLHYDIDTDEDSGGTWELVAKTDSPFGIFGLGINLTGINTDDILNQGPRGNVNVNQPAGFATLDLFPGPGFIQLAPRQEPVMGAHQGAFYRVGFLDNGSPTGMGHPAIPSLTNPQDIPWAAGPDTFGEAAWNVAAMFASGTFDDNVQPGFAPGSNGLVFTALGTTTSFGPVSPLLTVSTFVRDDLTTGPGGLTGDFNNDGVVDGADYVVWAKGSLFADSDGDNDVDGDDYDAWIENFNESAPGAGGGGVDVAVPEPAGALLVVFGLVSLVSGRPRRAKCAVRVGANTLQS
jgi:hypothetical protein